MDSAFTGTRVLGRSGVEVSAMGLGCIALGGPWERIHRGGAVFDPGRIDRDEATRAIHDAIDAGITFFDTAANYGAGASERMLGAALKGRRDKVVISTKFGYWVEEATRKTNFYDGDETSEALVEHIEADCEASLERLQTDRIDLYLFHVNGFPAEKAHLVLDRLERLVAAGKIRSYGWSTNNTDGARVFAEGEHCCAIEHHLNVMVDAPEMVTFCAEAGLANIAYSPLAAGLLSGKYSVSNPQSEKDGRGMGYGKDAARILGNLEAIREILTSKGRSLAQGALAWIWARSCSTIPIPGFRTFAQVQDNIAAMEAGPLAADEMKEIEELLRPAER